MSLVLVFVLTYLVGALSGSFILGRLVRGLDIRQHGSGNAGTTNAMRVMGPYLGLGTFAIDFAKAFLAMGLAYYFLDHDQVMVGGLGCVLGHDYPFYMKFKGGKGIASSVAIFLVFDFFGSLVPIFAGLLTGAISRYVSLGSLVFLTGSLISLVILRDPSPLNQACLLVIILLGIVRHRSNIVRLLKGEENRIGGKKNEA